MAMVRKDADMQRESYSWPEGTINWREVQDDPPGEWPGIYGTVDTQQFITREICGSEKLVVGRTKFHKGSCHEPHMHFYAEEYIYCLSGKCVVGAGDKEFLFTPGDFQFAKVGQVHWLRNPFDEPVEFIWTYSGVSMPFESGYATPDHFAEQMAMYKKGDLPK